VKLSSVLATVTIKCCKRSRAFNVINNLRRAGTTLFGKTRIYKTTCRTGPGYSLLYKNELDRFSRFWATVCKTVRPMLSDRCLSCPICLSVCLSVWVVGVLWPNGLTDQDETWHADRPRPWPHCVRWRPSSPSPKGAQPSPNFRPISVAAKWLHISRCNLV